MKLVCLLVFEILWRRQDIANKVGSSIAQEFMLNLILFFIFFLVQTLHFQVYIFLFSLLQWMEDWNVTQMGNDLSKCQSALTWKKSLLYQGYFLALQWEIALKKRLRKREVTPEKLIWASLCKAERRVKARLLLLESFFFLLLLLCRASALCFCWEENLIVFPIKHM